MLSQLPRNDYIPTGSRGSWDEPNKKLCWQAHDNYYSCINSQLEKNTEKINKYLCIDHLYMYETYCPAQFINARRFIFRQESLNKSLWNEEALDLINYKKNNKKLPDDALFSDPVLNDLKLFKSY